MFCLSAQTRGTDDAKVPNLLPPDACEPSREHLQALPGYGDLPGQRNEGGRPVSWLNVDFVPDNRKAYEAMEASDAAFEHSRDLRDRVELARTFPLGSPERDSIMGDVLESLGYQK